MAVHDKLTIVEGMLTRPKLTLGAFGLAVVGAYGACHWDGYRTPERAEALHEQAEASPIQFLYQLPPGIIDSGLRQGIATVKDNSLRITLQRERPLLAKIVGIENGVEYEFVDRQPFGSLDAVIEHNYTGDKDATRIIPITEALVKDYMILVKDASK